MTAVNSIKSSAEIQNSLKAIVDNLNSVIKTADASKQDVNKIKALKVTAEKIQSRVNSAQVGATVELSEIEVDELALADVNKVLVRSLAINQDKLDVLIEQQKNIFGNPND